MAVISVSVPSIHRRAYIVTLNSRNINEVRFWNIKIVISDNRRIKISRQHIFRFEKWRFLSYNLFVQHFSALTLAEVMIYGISIQDALNSFFRRLENLQAAAAVKYLRTLLEEAPYFVAYKNPNTE